MFDFNCGIRLRAFRPPPAADLDCILSLYNNRQVAPLISELFLVPRGEKLKEEFKEIIDKNAEMFCIIETIPSKFVPVKTENQDPDSKDPSDSNHEPQFIGITGLWGHLERGHRHTNYSIILWPEFWGKGYGKEVTKFMVAHAFLHMNMHRISLEVYEGNERAAAVYKKCGFVEEGRQRKVHWVNGAWRDIIHMGILAEEWTDMQKSER